MRGVSGFIKLREGMYSFVLRLGRGTGANPTCTEKLGVGGQLHSLLWHAVGAPQVASKVYDGCKW